MTREEMISALREQVQKSTDQELEQFMSGYTLQAIAGLLVTNMTPSQRAQFFHVMRSAFPEALP